MMRLSVCRLGLATVTLSTEGKVDVFAAVPRLALRAKLRHALPFFSLVIGFLISGAPRIIRGRLNADFQP